MERRRFRGGGRRRREIPGETRQPTAPSGTIPACEDPVIRPGIDPGEPVFFPGGVAPGFLVSGNRALRHRWSLGFLEDLQFPRHLHSGAAPNLPRFTLISFQNFDIKFCVSVQEEGETGRWVSLDGCGSAAYSEKCVQHGPGIQMSAVVWCGHIELAACAAGTLVCGMPPFCRRDVPRFHRHAYMKVGAMLAGVVTPDRKLVGCQVCRGGVFMMELTTSTSVFHKCT
ncbi:hypothetical protein PR048_000481 [Dryococelus australis]|uniref:Uncharacterized protein n=1 Tax=Dryococelus australis TaxID=614101 RepID=A0ABQ9IEV2_9NEOP|nr:hypothetical protein PR048_000481 [Dryococelus australis]